MRPVLAGITGGCPGRRSAVAVRCVWQVHAAMPEVPILGMGGIRTGLDALQFLAAGASAVSVGTVVFNDPSAPTRIHAELAAALRPGASTGSPTWSASPTGSRTAWCRNSTKAPTRWVTTPRSPTYQAIWLGARAPHSAGAPPQAGAHGDVEQPQPGTRPIAVALDTPDLETAALWAREVTPYVTVLKVGMELFYRGGPDVIDVVRGGTKVGLFLDLKLHDIPNTVAAAARSVVRLKPQYLTVHASGGAAMVRAAVEAAPTSSSPG